MISVRIITAFTLCLIQVVHGWDSQQLEVFDVVEEVKVNFYEFLSTDKDAQLSDIKAAFRRLSRELHPDKNPAENAEESFRNLVSIYEILKDPVKRKYYDEVLINGLPNWRSAVYYYRHVRHIGLAELTIILVLLISIGQYLVGWASYVEKKFTLEQIRKSKHKKAPILEDVPKPSLKHTLPIQVPCLIWKSIISLPWFFGELKEIAKDKIETMQQVEVDEEPIPRIRPVRRKKAGFVVPDGPTFTGHVLENSERNEENINKASPVISGGLWTDDDLADLVQLIKKYPGGTPNRWEVISDALGRSVPEVTYMANTLKSNGYRLPSQETEEPVKEPRVKKKTKGDQLENVGNPNQSNWSQEQQQALENAMQKFPKGHLDRWDRIADCIPDKTKEECMLRFKYLANLVKKQKEDREDKEKNAVN